MLSAYIGIDPGSKGALCLLVPELGLVEFKPTEDKPTDIVEWIDMANARYRLRMVMLENVSSVPGTSAGSNFKFGFNVGLLHGIVRASGYALDLVAPKKWQKEVGISVSSKLKGTARKRAIKQEVAAVCDRLYPKAEIRGPKGGLLDGRSDALMIAHYTYRLYP